MKIHFYPAEDADRYDIWFSVIVAQYRGGYLFCRHRERATWEIPGGHLEAGETPAQAAARELEEETGARRYDLFPAAVYAVERDGVPPSYGMLYSAKVYETGPLRADVEIAETAVSLEMPIHLTYPDIQPALFNRAVCI